jgi:regulator of protease activity HflC (stomatin/prohibitin superfamily)
MIALQVTGIIVGIVVLYLLSCIRILFEYQRGVIFRLGRVLPAPKGPGLIFVFWPIDRMVRISLRTHVQDVPSQDVITRDNVSVKVNAVVYFRVVDPLKAVLEVENYMYATSELSQTTLRSILGQAELDELLAEREAINQRLQQVIDQQTDPWGVKVALVEVKHVDLPDVMQRAMAKQAESERERRDKIIHAEGEAQAASKLREAAEIIKDHPMAMQMRFLQTLVDVGAENNTTIVFPVPIELASTFLKGASSSNGKPQSGEPRLGPVGEPLRT